MTKLFSNLIVNHPTNFYINSKSSDITIIGIIFAKNSIKLKFALVVNKLIIIFARQNKKLRNPALAYMSNYVSQMFSGISILIGVLTCI